MENHTAEILNERLNVEEILEKIRENIRRRQEAGEVPTDPDSCATASENCFHDQDDAIQRDLVYINSNWDIHNNSYVISSDRRYIGRALIKGRNLVHGEVRRYVDPIIYRQNGFNASTVRILNHSSQKSDELCRNYQGLDQKIRDLDNLFSRRQSDQDQKISQIKDMMENEIDGIIDARIHSHLFELDENIHARTWLAQILENRIREGFKRKIPASDQYPQPCGNSK